MARRNRESRRDRSSSAGSDSSEFKGRLSYRGAHSLDPDHVKDNSSSYEGMETGAHSAIVVNEDAAAEGSSLSENASSYSRSNGKRYSARKKMSTGKKVAIAVVCVLVVALVGCGIAAALWYNSLATAIKSDKDITMTETAAAGEPYYVLLLGGDSREDSKEDNRTDSVMVARVDEQNKHVSIVSVPRDLRVNIEGHGMCKINSAIEYGGYDTTIKEVNEVLGIKINYYAFIYFSGFKDLVDQLGGVTVEVPEGTYYNGVTVPAGDAVEINGKEALTLARCRHGNPPDQGAYAMGDYQRTLNQRNLIKAIAKKVLQQDVSQYPGLISSMAECVETNMDPGKIISMCTALKGMNTSKIDCAQLPICGDSIDGEWFAALYEDVFKVMRDNFVNGRKLMKGLGDFDTENNDNDLTSYCTDGDLYAYTSYADRYGGTFTVKD